MIELAIYLTNMERYNAGELVGEWLTLPMELDELKKAYDRIIGDAEYFITDYESKIGYDVKEFENIFDLNETIEELQQYDSDVVEALLYHGYRGDNLIIALEAGDYYIYYNCNDTTDVAYQVVEECGYLEQIPEHLQSYFDYERFGRELDLESLLYFTQSGNCVHIY